MKLTMLGTGHAMVSQCYNTCFALQDGTGCLLVDGGGGNGLLRQLEQADIRPERITDIFVTHRHLDHLLGIFWLLRLYAHPGPGARTVHIYSHDEVISILHNTVQSLFPGPEALSIHDRVRLIPVKDGEMADLLGRPVTFFDVGSVKAKQFGFSMEIAAGARLTCCGDEPLHEQARPYAESSKWLMHEAFCLDAEAEKYHPHKIHHSTVRDACLLAEDLGVENLILYHTEDRHLPERKQLYTQEGKQVFSGQLLVPDDLETIEI